MEDPYLRIRGPVALTVQEMLNAGVEEPLGHALWREAWDQRHMSPRSAMLLGVAALEVGIKQFISAAVPDSTWLVEEAPSPPIERMLKEYLPRLPPQGKAPPDDVLKIVRTAVQARNRVVHSGKANFSYETLEASLATIRDLLWKLDAERGFAWATDHLETGML